MKLHDASIALALVLLALPLWAQEPNIAADANPVQADPVQADQSRGNQGLEFFEQKVRPLLIKRCFECHSATSEKTNGGLRLDDRSAILGGGDNGPAAVEGKVAESLLIRAVHYAEAGFEMPPSGKLPANEIEVLERWVEMGLPMPAQSSGQTNKRVIDIEAGRRHWAFQPLKETDPPFDSNGWSRSRLDAYVIQSQTDHQLQPLPRASPEKLFRRIKFDLLGLPPTPEEQAAYLSNPSPEALDRYIDLWLASPRYGERWSRFWLELVRYCDVAESWAESQGNSYLYRDWVVNSLNADMPFDRFSRLQLSADQMPEAEPHDLAALGFIGLSPTYWKELQLPVEIIKMIVSDEYEERIHTFSSTFFGLNMACARCHDHKFDPITVQDYYALAGVFASTRIADRALVPGVDSLQVYAAKKDVEKWQTEASKLDAEIKKLDAEIAKLTSASTKPAGDKASGATAETTVASQLTDEDRKKLEEQTKQQADKRAQLEKLQTQIAAAKALPGFDLPLAPGAIDGTLEVKAAEGTHGSRIVYEQPPKNAPIEIRGNPNKTGDLVPRRFVSVLSSKPAATFSRGSGRLELADQMFEQSSPLIARVFVNRIWKHHFGIGLVNTPSDFGTQGIQPTHPELLDDLARRFIESGWSIKWLHREILSSATYQQQSRSSLPDLNPNTAQWYVGLPLQRLDVEQWRDSMMTATGTLDLQLGGPPTELSELKNNRRTLYGLVRRRELSDVLRLNDFPDPLTHSPERTPTTTPLQQLFVLNSPFMQQQASDLVARLSREVPGDSRTKIQTAYQWLFGRPASAMELEAGVQYVESNSTEVWTEYAQALLASNEFYFVD